MNEVFKSNEPVTRGKAKFFGLMISTALISACTIAPEPFSVADRIKQAVADQEQMFADQEQVAELTLYEAMARGLKYNRDIRIRMMEEAISTGQLDVSNINLLPKVLTEAGYNQRTNQNAATSRSVLTGLQTLEPSTSEERGFADGSFGLSWDLLDFGLSYVQAKQNADRVLITQERRRKAVHNLVMDIRFAFWRAAAAQRVKDKVEEALRVAQTALEDARKAEASNLQPRLANLRYQQSLLEVLKQLDTVRNDLNQAETELGQLLSLPPGTQVKLVVPDSMPLMQNFDSLNLDKLEDAALALRPELYEADYKERIASGDVRKAMLRALPGVQLNSGGYFTTNDFTFNNTWGQAGARFTWNLLDVFSLKKRREVAKSQKALAVEQRLALSIAILGQVRLAHLQVEQAKEQFDRARDIKDVSKSIAELTRANRISSVGNQLAEVRALTTAIASELSEFQTYAQVQNAYGRFFASLGIDPMPRTVTSHDIGVMANAFEGRLTKLQDGRELASLIDSFLDQATQVSASLEDGNNEAASR